MGKRSIDISKASAVVLDSWAVMAYLEDEASAQAVEDIMAHAQGSGVPLLMTVVNAGEIWYSVARKSSDKVADQSVEDIAQLGIGIIDADWNLTNEAARFKRYGKI